MTKISTINNFKWLSKAACPTCPTMPNFEVDRLGAKFVNVFFRLTPLLPNLPNLYIYIISRGYIAARRAGLLLLPEKKVEPKNRLRLGIYLKSLGNTVTNLVLRLGICPTSRANSLNLRTPRLANQMSEARP